MQTVRPRRQSRRRWELRSAKETKIFAKREACSHRGERERRSDAEKKCDKFERNKYLQEGENEKLSIRRKLRVKTGKCEENHKNPRRTSRPCVSSNEAGKNVLCVVWRREKMASRVPRVRANPHRSPLQHVFFFCFHHFSYQSLEQKYHFFPNSLNSTHFYNVPTIINDLSIKINFHRFITSKSQFYEYFQHSIRLK